MALSASTVWEVRTTGADTNGGGYVTGSSGTDFSQQAAAQFALTTVTTAAANAICLSASAATTMVGNIAQIISGTNFTAGFYQILSVVAGVSFTLDRTCTSAAGANGVVNIGGGFLTIQKAMTAMTVADQIAYVKFGTYNIASALTPVSATLTRYYNRIIGYNTTHGDEPAGAARPTVATNGNAIVAFNMSFNGWELRNFIIDGAGASKGTTGVSTSQYCSVINCKVANFSTAGLTGNNSLFLNCELTGNATAAINTGTASSVIGCWIHDNTGIAVNVGGAGCVVIRNIITNNTGASSDGIFCTGAIAPMTLNNVIYGCGRDGIRNANAYLQLGSVAMNNIIAKNVGFGINASGALAQSYLQFNYNALWSNTAGNYSGITAGANDVALSADPFISSVSSGAGNWGLSTTAAGLSLRAVGFPATYIDVTTVDYLDIGAAQHQDTPATNLFIVQD